MNIDPFELELTRTEIESDTPDSWLAVATAVIYLSRKLNDEDEYLVDAVEFIGDIADATLMLLS